MEANGLIERVRVPDDRRLVLVQPAEGGIKALSQTESTKRDAMRAVIRRPPPRAAGRARGPAEPRRALSAEVESTAAHRHHFETAN